MPTFGTFGAEFRAAIDKLARPSARLGVQTFRAGGRGLGESPTMDRSQATSETQYAECGRNGICRDRLYTKDALNVRRKHQALLLPSRELLGALSADSVSDTLDVRFQG